MFPQGVEARIASLLAAQVEPSVAAVELTRLAGGYSSGAWRVDVTGARPLGPLVLKAPGEPSVVYRRDACREGRILRDLAVAGAPVPAVLAIDEEGGAVDRPSFIMELVAGRSLADGPEGGFHADEWLAAQPAEVQQAVWDGFHDRLAELHRVDPAKVPDASHGPNGSVDVVGYWRAALLDVVEADAVPRQLAMLDWLTDHLPADADDAPAVCMGDARIVNCLVDDGVVRALVDFEVAYAGNPAADVGYSLFVSSSQRRNAPAPLPGIPDDEHTWRRWSEATGRSLDHREYWTAFGAMIIGVTATRAMVQWGLSGPDIEATNPLVAQWEAAVARAAAS